MSEMELSAGSDLAGAPGESQSPAASRPGGWLLVCSCRCPPASFHSWPVLRVSVRLSC